jgi:predicted RNA-binding Zn-ribbon protein involved in translation (DUF1610 family)
MGVVLKKKLVKFNCHFCKFDRWFTAETARRIARATAYYPFVCEKCGDDISANFKKMREEGPKWEGITIKC